MFMFYIMQTIALKLDLIYKEYNKRLLPYFATSNAWLNWTAIQELGRVVLINFSTTIGLPTVDAPPFQIEILLDPPPQNFNRLPANDPLKVFFIGIALIHFLLFEQKFTWILMILFPYISFLKCICFIF